MTTKLQVWNEALNHLGDAPIQSVTDRVPSVSAFQIVYDNLVARCFVAGDWNFAKRSVQLVPSALGVPAVGFSTVFDYPLLWLKTSIVSFTPDCQRWAQDIVEESAGISANTSTLYMRYIALDPDESKWPVWFADYVAISLARATCRRIKQSNSDEDRLFQLERRALQAAKSADGQNENVRPIYQGTWLTGMSGGRCCDKNMIVSGGDAIRLEEGDV